MSVADWLESDSVILGYISCSGLETTVHVPTKSDVQHAQVGLYKMLEVLKLKIRANRSALKPGTVKRSAELGES